MTHDTPLTLLIKTLNERWNELHADGDVNAAKIVKQCIEDAEKLLPYERSEMTVIYDYGKLGITPMEVRYRFGVDKR
tara:strand:+ start:1350 stop:1580 length:231 start_codon:yes stop_codon:yes gene_type:complete